MDELQVKIVVQDVDDNSPIFEQHNMTLGKKKGGKLFSTEFITISKSQNLWMNAFKLN